LNKDYARSMTIQDRGYAFLNPESRHDLQHGTCGYIDDNGQWQELLNLTNAASLGTFKAPVTVTKMRSEDEQCGPLLGSGTEEVDRSTTAGGSGTLAGVPVDASVTLSYKTSSDFGAVLHCPQPITRAGYKHKAPFRDWAKANAAALLLRFPDVRSNGFYVVTKTYSTPEAHTHAWTNPSSNVAIKFKVGSAGVAEVGPALDYSQTSSGSAWN
ncbi:hypothetical protein K461DRAFT_214663, partial [Myriangium duriaei CBS 260.36]